MKGGGWPGGVALIRSHPAGSALPVNPVRHGALADLEVRKEVSSGPTITHSNGTRWRQVDRAVRASAGERVLTHERAK